MTTANTGKTALLRRTILAGVVSLIGLAGAQSAGAAIARPLVDLKVVDRETGEEARVWRHQGRLFVAGRPGARYSLRVTNNSGGRVLVVMSVDGVNVLTGETAGYGQRGYILRPYVSADVSGWRKSDTEVAAFTFAPLSRSYAARTGRPNDVGVIGVAVFNERTYAPVAVSPRAPAWRQEEADASVGQGAQAAPVAAPPPTARLGAQGRVQSGSVAPEMARRSEKLGTGHGAREWSPVSTVAFERATAQPQYVGKIEYDSYENLVARGVIARGRPAPVRPQPFPSSPGYVPDPPHWR